MKNKNIPSLSLRKLLLSALVAAPVATLPAPLWALPSSQALLESEVVTTSGGVTFKYNSNTASTITTTNTNTIINWTNFGAGNMTIVAGDTLTYTQPTNGATLNLVTGVNPTVIAGNITSNGAIYVMNKNGITVDSTGVITATNVGLSAIDEGLAEFNFLNNGSLNYTGNTAGSVSVNGGTINVGSTGMVTLAGNTLGVAGSITGANLVVRSINATAATSAVILGNATALAVNGGNASVTTAGGSVTTGAGAVTVDKNLTISSSGGNVSLGNGAVTTVTGNLLVTTGGGNIVLGTSNVTVTGTTATLNASGTTTGGAISQTGGAFTVGTGTTAANLNLTSTGTTAGAVTLTNFGSASSNPLVTTIDAGATSLTGGTSGVTLNASTVRGNLAVSTTGAITSGGTVTVTGTASTIALTSSTNGNITFVTGGAGNFTALTGTGNISVTAGGDVVLPAISATNLTVTTTGNVTQTAAIGASGTTTLTANQATLTTGTNSLPTLVLKGLAAGGNITTAAGATLAKGTATTGDVVLTTTGALNIGAASADTISIGGNFTVTTNNNAVNQASDNTTISGTSTFNLGTGVLTLDGSGLTVAGVSALNNQYGRINATAASATILESTALNLGTITLTGGLTAYSKTGISTSGILTIPGAVFVGAGTASAPGAISLATTGGNATIDNNITGAIRIIDEINFLTGTATTPGTTIGLPLASSIAISNLGATNFALEPNVYSTIPNLPITITNIGSSAITLGNVTTSGLVTLSTETGAITATNTNTFGTVAVSSKGGTVAVNSTKDLTVNATLTTASAGTASFTTTGNLTLGTISSAYTGLITGTATGTVSDSVSGIAIFGPVSLSGKSISVTQAGHNFGGVALTTTGNGTIAFVESGTLRLTNVNSGTGAVSLSSSNGDVIQTAATNIVSGAATFSAVNGAVNLSQATNAIGGAIGITARNASTITQGGAAIVLGNITVSNGGLTVADTHASAVTQGNATTVNVFGAVNVSTTGNNDIVLGNSGNRFGALTLNAGTGNITVKELTTVNLGNTTAAKLTVTSEGGDIVDTGKVLVSGLTTLSAANITLDSAASDYVTLAVTATGDVSVVDTVGDIALGGSTVAGAFQVSTPGNITQVGNSTLNITGNTTFLATSGTSKITLDNFLNRFGAIRFTTGSGGATITEGTSLNLRGGSFSTGNVELTTGGDFVTSGPGGSSINGNLTINAVGNITPGAGSLLVTGTFTVNSASTKDLSALSKGGNLNSKDPVNLGGGTYVPPAP